MAKTTVVQMVDDLDKKPIADGDGESVLFGLDGVNYEIDLSSANAKKLRALLKDYVVNGRKIGSSRARGKADKLPTPEIRAWGKKNGFNLPDRGRLPDDVVKAWKERKGA